jgi:hypothetical protein
MVLQKIRESFQEHEERYIEIAEAETAWSGRGTRR